MIKTKYTSKFQVYTGKVVGGVEKLLGERVVNDLMTGVEGRNRILYIDNNFTSFCFISSKINYHHHIVYLISYEFILFCLNI